MAEDDGVNSTIVAADEDDGSSGSGISSSETATQVRAYCIIVLAVFGFGVNVACIGILVRRRRNSIFHDLLKVLAAYDLVVVVGCALLYALPVLWPFYSRSLYPRVLPWILPPVQVALMSSVYCTIVMSFERYIRICHLCQLRECSYITKENFR